MSYDFQANALKWEKLFVQAIRRVGTQVHPGLTIDEETLAYVDSLLYTVMSFLCSPSPKKYQDIEERVKATFPEDLTQWAVREAQEAIKKYRASNKKKGTVILCFPVEKVYQKLLKEISIGFKPDYEISVYLNAVLEYVSADVLKLAGNYTDNCKRAIITPKDVSVAISADRVLDQLFKFKSEKPLPKKPTFSKEEVVRDMMSVEQKYMRDLDMIVKVFLEAFEQATNLVTPQNIVYIFANIREIHDFEREFLYMLDEAREINTRKPQVGFIFEDMALEEKFEVYNEYAVNFENSKRELANLTRNQQFLAYLDGRGLKEAAIYVLPKLLIEPLYQIFHYFDLLKVLLKCTESADLDHSALRQAQVTLMPLEEELKRECKDFLFKKNNTFLKHGKNSAVSEGYFKDIQMKIENWEGSDLAVQCAELLKEGVVTTKETTGSKMLSTTKERYLFVFDNIILICKARGQPSANCDFHVKERLRTTGLSIRELPDSEDFKFAIEVTSSEGKKYSFSVKSSIERDEWVETFQNLANRPSLDRLLDKKIAEAESSEGPLLELDPKQYAFAEKDSTASNILFESEDVNPPTIKGGTIHKLVERLTYPTYADTNYLSHFLITYRSFCTPQELLNLLIKRYEVPEPPNATTEQSLRFRKNYITPVRLRVFNVFRQWVDKHYYDFENDTDLLKMFLEFIKDSMSNDKKMEKAVKSLTRAVRQRRETSENAKNLIFSEPPPEILKGSVGLEKERIDEFDILTLNPIEVARQLTLIESELYRSIKPSELVGQPWVKSNKEERSPNVLAMIHRFNHVSRWVATSVVETENLKERVDVVVNFLEVLDECRRLNNFNGMMEIISGLQATSVYRLKFTWNEVPAKKKLILEEAASLMARESNFKKFRSRLHSVNPPCIPFFGMYLTDLTFIEDGTSDTLPSPNGNTLINFAKRRRVASVIAEIQLHQNQPYNLQAVATIQDYLMNVPCCEEEEAFNKSLEIEPRNAEKPIEAPPGRAAKVKRSASNLSLNRLSRAGSQQDLAERRASQISINKRAQRANSTPGSIAEDEQYNGDEGPVDLPPLPPKSRPTSLMSVSPDNSSSDFMGGIGSGTPPPIPARRRSEAQGLGSPGAAPALPPKNLPPLSMSGSQTSLNSLGPSSPVPGSPALKNKVAPPLPAKANSPTGTLSTSPNSGGLSALKGKPLPKPN